MEVGKICLFELFSPRMKDSLQKLLTVLSHGGSTIIYGWATVWHNFFGPECLNPKEKRINHPRKKLQISTLTKWKKC
jgi:hypothetical protein